MSERLGIAAALLSSAVGGMAAAVTRFVIGETDPVTLAAFRFGGGFLVLLPLALVLAKHWPRGKDWPRVGALGVMFFALFFVLYNLALTYTTTARGTLALSMLPLVTMAVGAGLGVEKLSARKTVGVLIAVGGVGIALAAGLGYAPPDAWRGDLIMIGATLCMALYSVWSRPFIARSSALGFVTAGMGAGGICIAALAYLRGGFSVVDSFAWPQWLAVGYLALFGGALAFFLWVFALERTTPTRVAMAMTVNPLAAGLLATVILAEPIGIDLILGIVAVAAGLWVATTERRARA